jgi:hypothetical protein
MGCGAAPLDHWWGCCTCSREVNFAIWGESCPDCAHSYCVDCGRTGGAGLVVRSPKETQWTRFGTSRDTGLSGNEIWEEWEEFLDFELREEVRSTDSDILEHTRARNKQVVIRLNCNVPIYASADTGSSINCISKGYAEKLGISISNAVHIFKLPIKGREMKSIGITSIHCQFPGPPLMPSSRLFFVLSSLACDVILGNRFLRDTSTLDLHFNRMVDIQHTVEKLAVNSLGLIGERISCWLDGVQIWALPDTGATINLISSECARTLGYNDESGGKPFKNIPPCSIEFADGSESISTKSLLLAITFNDPNQHSIKSYKLVTLESPTSKRETCSLPPTASLAEIFYVLDELDLDVVLGSSLLYSVNAYSQHTANFKAVGSSDIPLISWGAKKRKREGNVQERRPLTDDQRLRDEMSLICDEIERAKVEVRDQYASRMIDQVEKVRREAEADRRFVDWLRENRERVERLWGREWYLRKVPQEVG